MRLRSVRNPAAARRQINSIDQRIVRLLAKRTQIVRKIGAFKAEHGMPILQPEREKELLAHKVELAKKTGLDPRFVTKFFSEVMAASRAEQAKVQAKLKDRPHRRIGARK